jgi:uncharacterized protein
MEASPVLSQDPPFRWEPLDLVIFVAFFAVTLVFLPVGSFLLFQFFQPDLTIETLSGVQQIFMQALMDCLLVGFILLLIKKLHRRPILSTLHFTRTENMAVGRLIAAGAFLAITVLLVSSFFPTPSDSPLEKLLTTTPSIVMFVVFGIAAAPILEEIIFRGFLFTALMDLFGWRVAVVTTSVLFAALHVSQLRGNWPAVIVIFLVGFVLTLVRYRTDSLIPSVIMHTAYNAMIFGISAIGTVLEHSPTVP